MHDNIAEVYALHLDRLMWTEARGAGLAQEAKVLSGAMSACAPSPLVEIGRANPRRDEGGDVAFRVKS